MKFPKTVLLGGNRKPWSYFDRHGVSAWTNGIESWVDALQGYYFGHNQASIDLVKDFQIVINNTNKIDSPSTLKKYLHLAESRPSSTKWVTLLEGDMTDYLKPRDYLRELLDVSDLVNCINEHTVSFFQQLTSTPVHYIGIPYPFNEIQQLKRPIEERTRRMLLCSQTLVRWNEFTVAKQLSFDYFGFEKGLSRKLRNLYINWTNYKVLMNNDVPFSIANRLYRDPSYQIIPMTSLQEFLFKSSNSWMWLNLDPRYTWGRYVLDAAALGIPIIATQSTGHASHLFPELTLVNEFEVDKAVDFCNRLIEDRDFYVKMSNPDYTYFENFLPNVISQKLLELLYS